MKEQSFNTLYLELSSLSVFRNLLMTPSLSSLLSVLTAEGSPSQRLRQYADFVSGLSEDDYSLSAFLRRKLFTDENPYVIACAKGCTMPSALQENALAELEILSRLTELTADAFRTFLAYDGYLPQFTSEKADFKTEYMERMAEIHRYGYGIFSSAAMFRLVEREIVPVASADEITISHFIGYESQRQQVLDNTKALLENRPAANVLLCGDAGTGKSSTVKACINHFYKDGLRLIELRKDQLRSLPFVLDRIAKNPLKFILFIDDLSFNQNDDSYSMLKAALEGSASAKAENAVIYATSNRRHIVKESFSDRESGDDVHRADTLQEMRSLSDRFGLTIYYERPNKALYLAIIKELADRYGITMPESELFTKAEAFALARGSRSARAAEQFINRLR